MLARKGDQFLPDPGFPTGHLAFAAHRRKGHVGADDLIVQMRLGSSRLPALILANQHRPNGGITVCQPGDFHIRG